MTTVVRRGVLAVLLLVVLAGCRAAAGDPTFIRLVVADGNLREEGVECAGAGPFRDYHRGARFVVEDRHGTVLAEGELPAGVSQNAAPGVEWKTERMPTVCVMDLRVAGLPADAPSEEAAGYRLRVGDRDPLPLDASEPSSASDPLVVLVQG